MTKKQIRIQKILTKALRKAQENGWEPLVARYPLISMDGTPAPTEQALHFLSVESIIFDHDFAKALWGRWPLYTHTGFERWKSLESPGKRQLLKAFPTKKDEEFDPGSLSYQNWEWHLMQMVGAEDPVKYLGEHI